MGDNMIGDLGGSKALARNRHGDVLKRCRDGDPATAGDRSPFIDESAIEDPFA
jgi:hypothetical protein